MIRRNGFEIQPARDPRRQELTGAAAAVEAQAWVVKS